MEKDNSKILKELQKQLDAYQKQNIELQQKYGKAVTDLEIEKCRRKEAEFDAQLCKKNNNDSLQEAVAVSGFLIGFIATTAFLNWWSK